MPKHPEGAPKTGELPSGVWKRADIPQPDLPDPVEGYGWTNENGLLEPKRSGNHVLPVERVDILETIEQDDNENDSEDEEYSNDEENDDESNTAKTMITISRPFLNCIISGLKLILDCQNCSL